MRPPDGRAWVLENFLERLDQWVEQEQPPERTRLTATAWILTRLDDPYQGVRREPDFVNLWFGAVPSSVHGPGLVVACSYWIFESERRLRCDSFASLRHPV